MRILNLLQAALTIFAMGFATLANAEDAISAINSCREAYTKFLSSDMRFSGNSDLVVGACQVTLQDAPSRLTLAKALNVCWRKNRSLTEDGDIDSSAAVRRNKCSAEQAHQIAIESAGKRNSLGYPVQKRADFMENCLKRMTHTACLDILTSKNSSAKPARIVEANLISTPTPGVEGVN